MDITKIEYIRSVKGWLVRVHINYFQYKYATSEGATKKQALENALKYFKDAGWVK